MLGRRVNKSYKTSGDKGFRKAQVLRAERNSAAGRDQGFPSMTGEKRNHGCKALASRRPAKRRPRGLRKLFNVWLTKGKKVLEMFTGCSSITFYLQSCELCALGSSVQRGDGIGFVSLEMIQCSSWFDWSQRNRFIKCDGLHCYFLKLTFLFILF